MSTKKKRGIKYFLYTLPFLVFLFAFQYVPLFGWIYAFTDYKLGNAWYEFGEFVGLKHFIKLFNMPNIGRIMRNTLIMSALGMVTTIFPLFTSILLNEIKSQKAKKWIQTVTTFPHFISWIILAGLSTALFSSTGVLNKLLELMGMTPFKYGLNANVDTAWTFMQGLNVWKGLGWSCIVYLAAISGIDSELYDAGRVDGANRVKLIRYITIPCLMPTFLVLLLLKVGNILDNPYPTLRYLTEHKLR